MTGRLVSTQANENYDETRVKAFVCDVTSSPLSEAVAQASVDVITLVNLGKSHTFLRTCKFAFKMFFLQLRLSMYETSIGVDLLLQCLHFLLVSYLDMQIFVLSAIAPEKMPAVVRNLKSVLKVI